MTRCTLELAGDLVAVANGGTFEAEYALFDPGEIELSAAGPGTIRETAYRTTCGEARSRLAQWGMTAERAAQAAQAARPWVARGYARGPAVRRIAHGLAAVDLFEGRTYDAVVERYQGAWLDLPSLAASLSPDLDPSRACVLMQALHLAALLSQSGDDQPLVLATAELTAQRRPGERTFKRLTFPDALALVSVFGVERRTRDREGREAGPSRREVIAWLRDRARRMPGESARYAAMEAELSAPEPPSRGPLADSEVWALELKLSSGETDGVVERIEAIERRHGRLPGTTYLRARVALMAGREEPRAVAERVSSLSTSMGAFHELQLLAAQAWAAAGDVRRAHAFARDLLEDTTASDSLHMQARDVLDATWRATTAPEGGVPVIPKPPLAPSGTEPGVPASRAPPSDPVRDLGRSGTEPARPLTVDLSLPAFRIEPRGKHAWSIAPDRARDESAESVETLSAPFGIDDQASPPNEMPYTHPGARLLCTHLARELARTVRERHGEAIRDDIDGLEIAQRYLRETLASDVPRSVEEDREVMRHGAFLSELLARRLGARWVDLETADPSRWAMLVPSRSQASTVCRVWPFARVLRFVALRHRERDLVSYYLQLEAHAG